MKLSPQYRPNSCNSNKYNNMTRYESCASDFGDESKGWCYTKSFQNDSAVTGEWGYCDVRCKSQDLIEHPFFNLASRQHSDLWDEHIFMLYESSSGHCHTYNPANSSFARNRGQFYAFLGRIIFKFLKYL